MTVIVTKQMCVLFYLVEKTFMSLCTVPCASGGWPPPTCAPPRWPGWNLVSPGSPLPHNPGLGSQPLLQSLWSQAHATHPCTHPATICYPSSHPSTRPSIHPFVHSLIPSCKTGVQDLFCPRPWAGHQRWSEEKAQLQPTPPSLQPPPPGLHSWPRPHRPSGHTPLQPAAVSNPASPLSICPATAFAERPPGPSARSTLP